MEGRTRRPGGRIFLSPRPIHEMVPVELPNLGHGWQDFHLEIRPEYGEPAQYEITMLAKRLEDGAPDVDSGRDAPWVVANDAGCLP